MNEEILFTKIKPESELRRWDLSVSCLLPIGYYLFKPVEKGGRAPKTPGEELMVLLAQKPLSTRDLETDLDSCIRILEEKEVICERMTPTRWIEIISPLPLLDHVEKINPGMGNVDQIRRQVYPTRLLDQLVVVDGYCGATGYEQVVSLVTGLNPTQQEYFAFKAKASLTSRVERTYV